MYLLRRTTSRAISSTPSKTLFVKPRSITTYAPAFRSRQQQWLAPSFQRRWQSEDATKVSSQSTAESAERTTAAAESFAQTAPEAPIQEDLTPVQENSQSHSNTETVPTAAPVQTSGQERQPRKRGFGVSPPAPNNVVYVGNLYYEVTEDQLKRVFSRFGDINKITVISDNRGLSRGFAYVEYQSVGDAQAAVDNLDMQVFEGRNLVVQFHRAKALRPESSRSNPPSRTIFIGNMSFEMSDRDLNDLFRDIKNVTDVRVAIDRRTGQPRGFAHADFIDVASATKALEFLNGKEVYGRQLRVDFSKAETQQRNRREDRREDTV